MQPRLYNVFPRLLGDLTDWPEHARHAAALGFDWFYVNPFHYPGFSGSVYAVKDYDRVDPLLLPIDHPDQHHDAELRGDGGLGLLTEVVSAVRDAGMKPVMDLVVNHTAKDSPLVEQHPDWYVLTQSGKPRSPQAIDPADSRKVTTWGDLAELDHRDSLDQEGLWAFIEDLVVRHVEIGFEGFRCDAAYKVPAELWSRLIAAARAIRPTVTFFGETLGARFEEIQALAPAGFDFIFNSSKWWDFVEPWCLDQLQDGTVVAPSISFPESHDTPRLWKDSDGSEAVQRQRYAFAAAFSTGIMMPIGYEYGFEKRLNVVHTRHAHWEEPKVDLTHFVTRVNAMKLRYPGLSSESVALRSAADAQCVVFDKTVSLEPVVTDQATTTAETAGAGAAAGGFASTGATTDNGVAIAQSTATTFLIVNRYRRKGHCELDSIEGAKGARVLRPCIDDHDGEETAGSTLELASCEVVYLVSE